MKEELKVEFEKYIISSMKDLLFLQIMKNILGNKLNDKLFCQVLSQEGSLILSTFFAMYINTALLEILKLTACYHSKGDYSFKFWLSKYSQVFDINVERDTKMLEHIYAKYKKVRNKSIAHLTTQQIVIGDFPKIAEVDDCIESIKRLVIKCGEYINCDLTGLNMNENEIKNFAADIDLTQLSDVNDLFYQIKR